MRAAFLTGKDYDEMVKLLIGGSPCTRWSIAQKNNRETEPSGIGWELFRNYLIAKEKFQPDFFLYENNKSAVQPIKDQISIELGVPLQYINSALVSAQNRQRFYAHNISNVPQPEDRGILLKEILESGDSWREKAYTLDANYHKTAGLYNPKRQHSYSRHMAAEPVCMRYERSEEAKRLRRQYEAGEIKHGFQELSELHPRTDGKTNTLSTVLKDNPICEPVIHGNARYLLKNLKYENEKTGTLTACCYKGIGADGMYTVAIPVEFADGKPLKAISSADGKTYPVYEVKNGLITIKDKQYPIKLLDGYYIIRKLTVTECCRLQTLPDDYCRAVSATQGYKGLGNGWTAEVIIHILKHANIPLDEEIIVLSMYDGIGTGRYCLDKMGYKNVKYYAYEIDKYPMQIAQSNYPDIIQCGDAFQVREKNWQLLK